MGRPRTLDRDAGVTSVRISRAEISMIEVTLGVSFSEFVREAAIIALAEPVDVCPTCGHISHEAREKQLAKIGEKLQARFREQQKIISAQEQAEEYRNTREKAIEEALTAELLKVRDFRQMLPENDPDGDYFDRFHAVVDNISTRCGFDVDSADVIRIYRRQVARA